MSEIATVAPLEVEAARRFLDGTTDKSEGNTNVWRARSLCAAKGKDGREQTHLLRRRRRYAARRNRSRRGLWYGIDDQVVDAYGGLLKTTKTATRSSSSASARGAFAARSLSGYVSRCGVIRPGSPLGVKQLYDRYKKGNQAETLHQLLEPGADRSGYDLEERWMVRDCAPIPVKFTGVWDTVGSVATTVISHC